MKAVGKLHKLWMAFSKFYEDNDQIDDARTIFEKAAKVQFRSVDDLAAIWCEYAEMELRIGYYSRFELFDNMGHYLRPHGTILS